MSVHQLGWVRSYRQALERLIGDNADHYYVDNGADDEDKMIAAVKLDFVSAMYSCIGPSEVIADMAVLRRENAK